MAALTVSESRDILDIIDDRNTSSTILASQLALEHWHDTMADLTVTDAVMDHLVHNAHKINLKGESMRKLKT